MKNSEIFDKLEDMVVNLGLLQSRLVYQNKDASKLVNDDLYKAMKLIEIAAKKITPWDD
ncbi:MAG: hypothetical protein L3J28_04420 [Candidatus Polarisedimenticolaceae bacterium]|nr:hypothetical protein [Candidatus Polarisedimenticolaceae bacterium]